MKRYIEKFLKKIKNKKTSKYISRALKKDSKRGIINKQEHLTIYDKLKHPKSEKIISEVLDFLKNIKIIKTFKDLKEAVSLLNKVVKNESAIEDLSIYLEITHENKNLKSFHDFKTILENFKEEKKYQEFIKREFRDTLTVFEKNLKFLSKQTKLSKLKKFRTFATKAIVFGTIFWVGFTSALPKYEISTNAMNVEKNRTHNGKAAVFHLIYPRIIIKRINELVIQNNGRYDTVFFNQPQKGTLGMYFCGKIAREILEHRKINNPNFNPTIIELPNAGTTTQEAGNAGRHILESNKRFSHDYSQVDFITGSKLDEEKIRRTLRRLNFTRGINTNIISVGETEPMGVSEIAKRALELNIWGNEKSTLRDHSREIISKVKKLSEKEPNLELTSSWVASQSIPVFIEEGISLGHLPRIFNITVDGRKLNLKSNKYFFLDGIREIKTWINNGNTISTQHKSQIINLYRHWINTYNRRIRSGRKPPKWLRNGVTFLRSL